MHGKRLADQSTCRPLRNTAIREPFPSKRLKMLLIFRLVHLLLDREPQILSSIVNYLLHKHINICRIRSWLLASLHSYLPLSYLWRVMLTLCVIGSLNVWLWKHKRRSLSASTDITSQLLCCVKYKAHCSFWPYHVQSLDATLKKCVTPPAVTLKKKDVFKTSADKNVCFSSCTAFKGVTF